MGPRVLTRIQISLHTVLIGRRILNIRLLFHWLSVIHKNIALKSQNPICLNENPRYINNFREKYRKKHILFNYLVALKIY